MRKVVQCLATMTTLFSAMRHNINMIMQNASCAVICATIFFTSSLYCEQEAISTTDAALILVSAKRIEGKKTEWKNHATIQRIKRNAIYISSAILVLWGIYSIWWKEAPKNTTHTQAPLETPISPSVTSNDFFRQHLEYNRSIKGIFFNTLSQSIAFGLAGACVTLLMSRATTSGTVILEQLKAAFGFGEENIFLDVVHNAINSCRQLAKSTEALSNDMITSSNAAFQEMWYKSILSNITTYHFTFIHAFEEWIAYTTVLLESKNYEPEITTRIQQSLLTIATMLSVVIKKEQEMVTTQMFNKEATSEISYMLRGICQEITESSYHIGYLCYDNAFSLEKP